MLDSNNIFNVASIKKITNDFFKYNSEIIKKSNNLDLCKNNY